MPALALNSSRRSRPGEFAVTIAEAAAEEQKQPIAGPPAKEHISSFSGIEWRSRQSIISKSGKGQRAK